MSDYATLSEFHSFLNVDDSDTTNDVAMALAITAASSGIDRECNRVFGLQDSVATLRYYSTVREHGEEAFLLPSMQFSYWYPYSGDWSWFWTTPERKVLIDDLFLTNQILTDIVVRDHDTQAVLTVDRLWPFNADKKGKPFTALLFLSSQAMPRGEGAIDVTAKFGYPTIPSGVKYACLLQASRYFVRRLSPSGLTAGADALGNSMRFLPGLDRDVSTLLIDHKKWWSAV